MKAIGLLTAPLLAALLLAGCQSSRFGGPYPRSAADRAFSELLVMMQDRLELHHESALLRWDGETAPDSYREDIDPVLVLWEARGLPPHRGRSFFNAQLRAGEIVQQTAFSGWREEGQPSFEPLIDFAMVLRPELQQHLLDMEARLAAVQSGELNLDYARQRVAQARESMRASENIPDGAVEVALSPFRYHLRLWR